MKKLLICALLLSVLCASLMLGTSALDKYDHGYYDYDSNGTVDLADALDALSDIINAPESDISLVRIKNLLQGAVSSVKISATVLSVDYESGMATISTDYCDSAKIPLSMLGINESVDASEYAGVPAVLSVHAPASRFFTNYANDGKGIYLVRVNENFDGTPINPISKLYTISELNRDATNGSHNNDNYKSASLETNFRETAILTSEATGYARYDNAWYPRIKKVNDNLYLMLYMYGQYGQHLYYVTSADGVNWNAPEVLWNSADFPAFTYADGELEGTSDRYHAANPDACVLDDGTILCVYAVRAVKGYRYYPTHSGLFMKRGTPTSDGKIEWSDEFKIYTGQVWEPSIIKLSNGEVHVYFTQVAPDIVEHGYDESHRSTETGLIISKDGFNTWAPNVQAGDTNFYRAITVFREYVGDKLDAYSGKYRPHFNGQMPVVTELSNGKLFLATEIKQLNNRFKVSYVISDYIGAWKELEPDVESKTFTKLTTTGCSSPYVDRFTSGEIYLTYNYWHNGQDYLIGRIGKPDGSSFNDYFYNAGNCEGIWGACDVMDSHKAATIMQDVVSSTTKTESDGSVTTTYTYGINLYYHYLNHRINAQKKVVILDGFINDWESNSDALFVGSETQAQATVQVAHDKNNVYFLVTRLDKYLTSKDTVTMHIADGTANYYSVTFGVKGNYTVTYTNGGSTTTVASGTSPAVKRFGTVDINTNTDQGVFVEFAVQKSELGLVGDKSFKAVIELVNKDASSTVTTDTLTNVDMTSTANWIDVVLD